MKPSTIALLTLEVTIAVPLIWLGAMWKAPAFTGAMVLISVMGVFGTIAAAAVDEQR